MATAADNEANRQRFAGAPPFLVKKSVKVIRCGLEVVCGSSWRRIGMAPAAATATRSEHLNFHEKLVPWHLGEPRPKLSPLW